MRHGSLFSGGGGFDLAAEKMGWQNVFHCEKDTFCLTILRHYWPDTITYKDIGAFDATPYQGKIDIITGGFPCQPFSAAGKRAGTADDRYLWPAMYCVIREIKPRWVVCENVYGLLNWSEGLVFDKVQSDLEAEGYEVAAYVLPAAGVNAPHQRYRVWIVGRLAAPSISSQTETVTDTHCKRQQLQKKNNKLAGRRPRFEDTGYRWQDWPTQSPLCGGDDGLPARLDGITVSSWRNKTIRMFGNAIVPELALQLFKTIAQYDNLKN